MTRLPFINRSAPCLAALSLLPGCMSLTGDPPPSPPALVCPDAVTAPITGASHRYVTDQITAPVDPKQGAADLDGDGHVDNAWGVAWMTMAAVGNANPDVFDALLAVGRIGGVVTITSDDPAQRSDTSVSIRWAPGFDGSGGSTTFLGALADGHFNSPLARCQQEDVAAHLTLPLLSDADPLDLPTAGTSLEAIADSAAPDTGWTLYLRGGLPLVPATDAAYANFVQSFGARPWDHLYVAALVDLNGDGVISRSEFDSSDLIKNFLAPDLNLFEGSQWKPGLPKVGVRDSLSFVLALHVRPCESGSCRPAPAPSCLDRLRNSDESDVDCGGHCSRCGGGLSCSGDSDCNSRRCTANRCTAPTCDDGVLDGVETDIDCGGAPEGLKGCPKCAANRTCVTSVDCASNQCNQGKCK